MRFVWSKIGSRFGEPGGTTPPKNFQEYPPIFLLFQRKKGGMRGHCRGGGEGGIGVYVLTAHKKYHSYENKLLKITSL